MADQTEVPRFEKVEEALAALADHDHEYGICDGGSIAWEKCPAQAAVLLAVAEEVERADAAGFKRASEHIGQSLAEVLSEQERVKKARAEGVAQGRREMAREALAEARGKRGWSSLAYEKWLSAQAGEGKP